MDITFTDKISSSSVRRIMKQLKSEDKMPIGKLKNKIQREVKKYCKYADFYTILNHYKINVTYEGTLYYTHYRSTDIDTIPLSKYWDVQLCNKKDI